MRSIDVCLSPELISLYDIKGRIIVVIDILRATSCMTTAFAHGVKSILPVASLEECRKLKNEGFTCAAERDGKKEDGFDLGNSPFSYMEENLKDQNIAMTTTNGTLAITLSKDAKQVIVGSFLNLSALVDYLSGQNDNIILLCSGWKGKVNLEDSIFAGAVIEALLGKFAMECDAPLLAMHLYKAAKYDMADFLKDSSHVKRLRKLNIQEDIVFCLTKDKYDVIPVLQGKVLVKMEIQDVVA
ncbi:MAG: 2-phosphosulfolactate phosphatase [Bacteroidota bacterium]|jgi:2-phosphosulfolactate phosphatase|nr:2-phosphosulfolactate phosphatase [Bacteroidota bacterium]